MRVMGAFILGVKLRSSMSIQIEIQKEKPIQKSKHKLSQVLLNAPEKQCSGKLRSVDRNDNKEYCALGLGLLYFGYKF